jgi:hypothetical protein
MLPLLRYSERSETFVVSPEDSHNHYVLTIGFVKSDKEATVVTGTVAANGTVTGLSQHRDALN